MSKTSTDYLIQLAPTGATRGNGLGLRPNDQVSLFGDHLSQASLDTSAPSGTNVNPRSSAELLSARKTVSDNPPQYSPQNSPPNSAEKKDTRTEQGDASRHHAQNEAQSASHEPQNEEEHAAADEQHDQKETTELTAEAAAFANKVVPDKGEAVSLDSGQKATGGALAELDADVEVADNGKSESALKRKNQAAEHSQKKHSKATEQTTSTEEVSTQELQDGLATHEKAASRQPLQSKRGRHSTPSDPRTAGHDPAATADANGSGNSAESKRPESDTASSEKVNPADEDTAHRQTDRRASRVPSPEHATKPANATAIANTDTSQTSNGELMITENTEEPARSTSHTASQKGDVLANLLARPHSAGSTHSGNRAAGEEESPRVDAGRFIGRVAKAFQSAQERGGTLQLRLSPPELGSLRLELAVKDGVMTATLETETPAARRLLLDHLPALRDRLAEQNIRIERFDVDLRREGTGGQTDQQAAHQQQEQHGDGRPTPRRPTVSQFPTSEPESHQALDVLSANSNTEINLVV